MFSPERGEGVNRLTPALWLFGGKGMQGRRPVLL